MTGTDLQKLTKSRPDPAFQTVFFFSFLFRCQHSFIAALNARLCHLNGSLKKNVPLIIKCCLKYIGPSLDKALLPVEMEVLVPAQQVGEGTWGRFKKRGQALLRSDKTGRAGDIGAGKKGGKKLLLCFIIHEVNSECVLQFCRSRKRRERKGGVVIKMARGKLLSGSLKAVQAVINTSRFL